MLRYGSTTRRPEGKIGCCDPRESSQYLDAPIICKSDEVADNVAKEALKNFYRITEFQIGPYYVQQCLDEQVWGTVSAKDAIRHIEIDIPRFRPLKEPHMLDEIPFQLSALQSLKPDKVAIHLTIEPPKYQTMTNQSFTAAAQRACAKT